MKNFKRLLASVLVVLMLLPMGIVTSFADELDENWTTMSAKYSSKTDSIILDPNTDEVVTEGFTYTVNENGGIDAFIPDSKTFNGVFGTAVLSSKNAVALDGLTVSLTPSDSFTFNLDTKKLSSSISFIWSDTPITSIEKVDNDQIIATNGLRTLAPNVGNEIAIILNNRKTWKDPNDLTGKKIVENKYASNLSVILYKEGWCDPTSSRYPGYRWTFTNRNNIEETPDSPGDNSGIKQSYECIDCTELTYEFRPDTDLGYRVVVNGKEYYKGEEVAFFPENTGELGPDDYIGRTQKYLDSYTYAKDDINLSSLGNSSEGYITIGVSNNLSKKSCGYTLDTINGVPAAQWNGQTLGEHVHNFEVVEEDTMDCLHDGYVSMACSCGAHYRVCEPSPGHDWVVVSEKAAGCLEVGEQLRRCRNCGEEQTILTPATGHGFVDYGFPLKDNGPLWGEWEVTTPATPEADGVMSRTCPNCGEVQTKAYQYSDADKISDKWFISAENRYYTLQGEKYRDLPLVYTTVGEDGSITLKDIVAVKEDGISNNSITKITSKNTSSLDSFSATVTPLPASETSDARPTSISFMWTNEYDNYRFAGQYSSGLYLYYREIKKDGLDEVDAENPENIAKAAGKYQSSTAMEDARAGYAWSHYISQEEYSLCITLLDYMVALNATYGTPDDNYYDIVTYSVVSAGNFWTLEYENLATRESQVDATQPIDILVEYFPDEDSRNAGLVYYEINGEEFYTRGITDFLNYKKDYYFSVAAYSDGMSDDRSHGASFTLNTVCGVPAAEFEGYVCTEYCEHDWGELSYVKDKNGKEDRETCLKMGKKVRICNNCGAKEYEAVPKAQHNYDTKNPHWVKQPTCVERGIIQYYCNFVCDIRDGVKYTHGLAEKFFVPATGVHTWTDWETVSEPTCKAGEKTHYCTVCHLIETEEIEPVREHEWGEWITDTTATYTREGHKYAVCAVCGDKKEESIDKLALPENPFKDIPEGKWFTKAVLACYARGYMTGVKDDEFGPNTPLTRAMFVTILSKIAGADTAPYKNVQTQFTDVKTGKWYSGPIAWAVENGYSSGLSKTIYGTNSNVTREQLATFLNTYATKNGLEGKEAEDITGYPDYSKVAKWARSAMAWAVGNGLISGVKTGEVVNLDPKGNATRAQVAVIVNNFVDNIVLAPQPIPED
ncbi:MAG: S-layer homology domain-containing protein [Clostridia bacterium]|nr:S-layer homology domain-containing protein [Clostridia bacterium]